MQKQLKGRKKKKKDTFEKIADEMQSLGVNCTGYQCENKMYKLIKLRNKV